MLPPADQNPIRGFQILFTLDKFLKKIHLKSNYLQVNTKDNGP